MIFKNDAIKYGKMPNSHLNLVLTMSANFINKKDKEYNFKVHFRRCICSAVITRCITSCSFTLITLTVPLKCVIIGTNSAMFMYNFRIARRIACFSACSHGLRSS